MGIDVRTITDDEIPAWSGAVNTGFLEPAGDIDAEVRRPSLYLERTWAGWDGERVIGTLRSFPAEVTVPGRQVVPCSGITAVTVTSTHTRRGVATAMITADLAAARDRGEVMATLISAEWPIYGRFGFGAATEGLTFTVDARQARMRRRPEGTTEYVDLDTARKLAPEIFDQHRLARPGEMSRDDRRWDVNFDIIRFPSWPEPKKTFHVLARDADGSPVGRLRFLAEENHSSRLPDTHVRVGSMHGVDRDAEALLWQHLLDLDLVATITAENRPADEILPWLLTDARHAEQTDRCDMLWVRPLDVPTALSARAYWTAGQVILDVVDPVGLCGGRYALQAGPDGATCTPTTASADLTLDIGSLSSAYLGGYPLRTLAAAGLVDEHAPGAVHRADLLFAAPVTPWCTTWF